MAVLLLAAWSLLSFMMTSAEAVSPAPHTLGWLNTSVLGGFCCLLTHSALPALPSPHMQQKALNPTSCWSCQLLGSPAMSSSYSSKLKASPILPFSYRENSPNYKFSNRDRFDTVCKPLSCNTLKENTKCSIRPILITVHNKAHSL